MLLHTFGTDEIGVSAGKREPNFVDSRFPGNPSNMVWGLRLELEFSGLGFGVNLGFRVQGVTALNLGLTG